MARAPPANKINNCLLTFESAHTGSAMLIYHRLSQEESRQLTQQLFA